MTYCTNYIPPELVDTRPDALQRYLCEHPINEAVPAEDFIKLFSTPRFSRSAGEEECIRDLLMHIPGMQQDQHGNVWIRQGDSRTLFSCHTDTVHKRTAVDKYPIQIDIDGWLSVSGGGVLGADCGAGWIIMLCMLKAGVPGLYVWHRDEEVGGAGSVHFAAGLKHFGQYDRCIAFDRMGYGDVITHQSCGRCCSDEFAAALAASLNAQMPETKYGVAAWPLFEPDDTGVFTDSANYVGIVPECTNLSVGYFGHHTTKERQDLLFLQDLIEACCAVDWEALPTVRNPDVPDPDDVTAYNPWQYIGLDVSDFDAQEAYYKMTEHEAISDLVRAYPDSIADLLMAYSFSIDDIRLELGI